MIHTLNVNRDGEREDVVLRPLDESDLPALWQQKNDPEVADLLGGFGTGMSHADVRDWLEFHRKRSNEVLWAIVGGSADGPLLGHVGLYEIDHRVRQAEFAVMLGERACWGKGIGKAVTAWAVDYGFSALNLNRVHLSVLADNTRAVGLYEGLGFEHEGVLRQAQFKGGRYRDVVLMSVLAADWARG